MFTFFIPEEDQEIEDQEINNNTRISLQAELNELHQQKQEDEFYENKNDVIIPFISEKDKLNQELQESQESQESQTAEELKISELVGKLRFQTNTKDDAEILVALSKLTWRIESYFEARDLENEKEENKRSELASYTVGGVAGTTGGFLAMITAACLGDLYFTPVLGGLSNKIYNLTASYGGFASNYTSSISTIKNQFTNTDVSGVQQYCAGIEPNPRVGMDFINGYCKSIFESYLNMSHALRRYWITAINELRFRVEMDNRNGDCWRERCRVPCDATVYNLRHEWKDVVDPYSYNYNCSDASLENRSPFAGCQKILDIFCKSISPYASVNSFPPFANSSYGHAYMNDFVNGTCSSVYTPDQLYNCSIGYVLNNTAQTVCDVIKTNYCNITAEFIRYNQTQAAELNSLNDSYYKNSILNYCSLAATLSFGLVSSAYLLKKVYYRYKYVDSGMQNPISLENSLFAGHNSNIQNAIQDLSKILESKNDARFSALNLSLNTVKNNGSSNRSYLDEDQLAGLLAEVKKQASYFTNTLRLKSFAFSRVGVTLFSAEKSLVRKIAKNFEAVCAKDSEPCVELRSFGV
jgi:hypothetical protein